MKLLNGDCLIEMDKIKDNSIDLIITSPPYNIDLDYDIYNDYRPWEEYMEWVCDWLYKCYKVLKDDGRICINHYLNFQDRYEKVSRFPLFDIKHYQDIIGFNTHKLVLWEDITRKKYTAWGSWLSASSPYINTPYEGILVSYKNQWKKTNKGVSSISKEDFIEGVGGIWKLGTSSNKKGTKATFPISLPTRCIELFSYEGDTILDPFMGSGTTGVACKKLKRDFIGIELSENYFEIAKGRIGI